MQTRVGAHEEERENLKKTLEVISNTFSMSINIRKDPNSTAATQNRKMLVDETFGGRFEEPPKITTFPTTKKMDQAIISGPIRIESTCSHHWMPFIGEAYIGYIPVTMCLVSAN